MKILHRIGYKGLALSLLISLLTPITFATQIEEDFPLPPIPGRNKIAIKQKIIGDFTDLKQGTLMLVGATALGWDYVKSLYDAANQIFYSTEVCPDILTGYNFFYKTNASSPNEHVNGRTEYHQYYMNHDTSGAFYECSVDEFKNAFKMNDPEAGDYMIRSFAFPVAQQVSLHMSQFLTPRFSTSATMGVIGISKIISSLGNLTYHGLQYLTKE